MVRRVCEAGLFLCALLLLSACKQDRKSRAALAPLRASSWLIDLDVPGFGRAALAVPLGATQPRAIVIALHGAADRPEWACSAWRSIVGPAPFVLCPRGVPRADLALSDARFSFGSAEDTARELRAALSQLKARFGPHVAPGPVVFVGFEVGADHAASIARQEPAFFSRLLLVAADASSWPSSQSALFGREGGRRVLFAFGPEQRAEFEQKAVLTQRGGAEARAISLADRPPALDSPSRALLAKQWRWLSASTPKPAVLENIAGNALSADGPIGDRSAP